MRWWRAALASGVSGRGRRIGGAALAAGLALQLASSGSAAARGGQVSTFTGFAFDACNAPAPETLQSWLASPYRALGIYIGGANRACANLQLSPSWAAGAVAAGWSLIPIYVGRQAPCTGGDGLARIDAGSASSEGTAAAEDAVADSSGLGLPAGTPIYLDLEAYAVHDAACTQTVQTFVSAWTTELHALGYLAGVYGSAASAMRDLQPLAATASLPDDIWIADWNGVESVFGDSYVSDTLWTNHQRLHQYQGGHHETWGSVTIEVDSSYVDGAVVSTTVSAPPAQPAAAPTPVPSSAGSVSSTDGVSTVSWAAGAFQQPVVVTLTPAPPSQPVPGFGNGGYGVQLQVAQTAGASLPSDFALPLTIHLKPLPGELAALSSTDGVSWSPLPPLVAGALPAGANAAYSRNPDGSFDITTAAGGYFAVRPELVRPPAPATVSARFSHGRLVLQWPTSVGATGAAISYQVTLSNHPVLTLAQTTVSLGSLQSTGPSVFRIVATDAAGKVSEPSQPVVVVPSNRPVKLPKIVPQWAWRVYAWQQGGNAGPRPNAPKILPAWYWRWFAWHVAPFHLRA